MEIKDLVNQLLEIKSGDITRFINILEHILESIYKINKKFMEDQEYDKVSQSLMLLANIYILASKIFKRNSELEKAETFLETSKILQKQSVEFSKMNSSRIQMYIQEAHKLQSSGIYEKAISLYNKALNANPSLEQRLQILMEQGNSYFIIGQLEKAKNYYEEILNKNISKENKTSVLVNLGNLYMELGNKSKNSNYYKEALDKFTNAININPDDAFFHLRKGIAYYQLGNFQDAKKCFKTSISMNKKNSDAYTALAAVYNDYDKNYLKAKKYLDIALMIDPESIYTKLNLAEILLLLEDYNSVEEYCKDIISRTNSPRFRFVSSFLKICANLLQNKINSEFYYLAYDLLLYCESLPIGFVINWNFTNIMKKIEKSNLENEVKRFIYAIYDASKVSFDKSTRYEILENIRNRLQNLKIQYNINEKNVWHIDYKKISINTVTKKDIKEGGYYWEISIELPKDIALQIDTVKAFLPQSFPNSELDLNGDMERKSDTDFKFKGYAWEDFPIRLEITLNNKEKINKYHRISFS